MPLPETKLTLCQLVQAMEDLQDEQAACKIRTQEIIAELMNQNCLDDKGNRLTGLAYAHRRAELAYTQATLAAKGIKLKQEMVKLQRQFDLGTFNENSPIDLLYMAYNNLHKVYTEVDWDITETEQSDLDLITTWLKGSKRFPDLDPQHPMYPAYNRN